MVSGPPSPVKASGAGWADGERRELSKGNSIHQPWTLPLDSSYLSISSTDGVKNPRVPTGELCSIRYMGNLAFSGRNPLFSPLRPWHTWKREAHLKVYCRPISKLQMEGTSAHFIHLCFWFSEEEIEICRCEVVGPKTWNLPAGRPGSGTQVCWLHINCIFYCSTWSITTDDDDDGDDDLCVCVWGGGVSGSNVNRDCSQNI